VAHWGWLKDPVPVDQARVDTQNRVMHAYGLLHQARRIDASYAYRRGCANALRKHIGEKAYLCGRLPLPVMEQGKD
jgi:hypothetical protein